MKPITAPARARPGIRRGLVPGFMLATGAWLVLSGGAPGSLIVGVPTIVAAIWAGARLRAGVAPGAPLRWSALPGFIAYYLIESLRGGLDVARRVLSSPARLRPTFLTYRTTLTTPAARLLFANGVSLLPGTLTADLHGDRLRVHVLHLDAAIATDGKGVAERELAHLERRIARLFGETQR